MNKVRTRYAPSPTGYFHIGGARTALFNYLYAKHYNGEFIVRIEDTDTERNVENGAESQLDNLKWLNIFPDESILNPTENGPYRQSEKLHVYEKLANQLLAENKAYRCFCTSEELEKSRSLALERGVTPKYARTCLYLSEHDIQKKLDAKIPFAIRLKLPDDRIYEWHDLIRKDMSVPSSAMTDPVILKSSKIAMYNFAVVVDDHDMKITHIFRGEEHISNTPYQIAIKEALGYKDNFIYGHLSIIVDETGKKLSKRNLALEQFIEGFRNKGYLPEVMVNFMALLGWTDEGNQEILSMNDLIKKFTIERVNSSPAFFDIKKLNWLSNEYFKKMDEKAYLSFVEPFFEVSNPVLVSKKKELALLFKQQLSYGQELTSLINENFHTKLSWMQLAENDKKYIKESSHVQMLLSTLLKKLKSLSSWDETEIKTAIKETGNELAIKGKDLFMPIRLAVSNQAHGPELAKIMNVYPQEKLCSIIEQFIHGAGI
ncbi:glutamate--tRNA ligase [[Mycoplasma] testudinis]|uniref:glutamate--tRNA ligase n=1 Tax=[Mycoplasma] testudinis TaxID=33924 RepID=UPI0004866A7E|nr:glutamate--tRNA ligase [[Mycoplasma] testudinis]